MRGMPTIVDFMGGKISSVGNPLPNCLVLCKLHVNSKIIYIDVKSADVIKKQYNKLHSNVSEHKYKRSVSLSR